MITLTHCRYNVCGDTELLTAEVFLLIYTSDGNQFAFFSIVSKLPPHQSVNDNKCWQKTLLYEHGQLAPDRLAIQTWRLTRTLFVFNLVLDFLHLFTPRKPQLVS